MRLTPDGVRYLAMGAGERQPMPFHLRWGAPMLCRTNEAAWIALTFISIALVAAGTGWLAWTAGATPIQSALAVALILGMPCIRFAAQAPVLADMPAMATAVGAALLWPISPEVALAVAFVSGAFSEKAPIVAALGAWQPWLLLGLAVPALRMLVRHGEVAEGDPLADTMLRPIKAGFEAHSGRWRSLEMVLPWGACLIVLAAPSLQTLALLAFGYSLLFVATDTVRLYQTVSPFIAIQAALMVPDAWVPAVAVIHWFNPFGGNGL